MSFNFDPSFIPLDLSYEITKIEKSAQLGAKSVNMKILGHEIQFDPDFIPLWNNKNRKNAQLGVKFVNI